MTESDALAPLREALRAREAAPRDAPVRVHNRLMTAVNTQAELLAETEAGRRALMWASRHDDDLWLRLIAATTVQRWDADSARATLVEIVERAGGTVVRPMTMTTALAVDGEPARTAALCLLNLDHPKPPRTTPAPPKSRTPVPSASLDAAERVYGLAMNGGLEHAFELAGDDFPAAASACEAIGATEAAAALRAVIDLAGPSDSRSREDSFRKLSARKRRKLDALDARFARVDDLMARLEAAVEGS